MIYFVSDLHLYHEGIIKMQNRPFANVDEMNRVIINNYNATVKKNDICYILGDICHHSDIEKANDLIKKLNGEKILIRGNHDIKYDNSLFSGVFDYLVENINNKVFVMSHYPFLDWYKANSGSINIHGHIHSHKNYNIQNKENHILRYDVGIDANNFCPVSVYQILNFFEEEILNNPKTLKYN